MGRAPLTVWWPSRLGGDRVGGERGPAPHRGLLVPHMGPPEAVDRDDGLDRDQVGDPMEAAHRVGTILGEQGAAFAPALVLLRTARHTMRAPTQAWPKWTFV